jgi:hypothetical protein
MDVGHTLRYFCLVSAMLPHTDVEQVKVWLDGFLWKHWALLDNSVAHNMAMYKLLARTAKNTLGKMDWQQHLPKLMSRFMLLLSPDVGQEQNRYNVGASVRTRLCVLYVVSLLSPVSMSLVCTPLHPADPSPGVGRFLSAGRA